ncbi:hypothetical protein [Streptomyces sp. NBC_01618]|uniref:hypothetical protein n=1 Tax=Streptomyces sp. NBC_01618 TaxID=2975900 RepID=UPI003870B272|nr:hypothetical protein OH735_24075 [Streptomyces sp. NBC_01618]
MTPLIRVASWRRLSFAWARTGGSRCCVAHEQWPVSLTRDRPSLGTDEAGNSYIAVTGAEAHYLTDSREALQQMIRDIKAGKADHLL